MSDDGPAIEYGAMPLQPAFRWARAPVALEYLMRVPLDEFIEHVTARLVEVVRHDGLDGPVTLSWWAELSPFVGVMWTTDGPEPAGAACRWAPGEQVPHETHTLALWAGQRVEPV